MALNRYTVDEVGCVAGAADPRAAWLSCYTRLNLDLDRAQTAWRAAEKACRGVALPRPRSVLPVPALSSAPERGRDLALLGAELSAARSVRLLSPHRRKHAFRVQITPLMREEAELRPGAVVVR
ncbi:MAG: hypothetical protein ACRD13_07305 [Terriglobales bacterium]